MPEAAQEALKRGENKEEQVAAGFKNREAR